MKSLTVISRFATCVAMILRPWMCLHPSNGCKYCNKPFSVTCWVYLGPDHRWIHVGTIVLTTFHKLQHWISANTHTDPHSRMQEYDGKCTSRTNWFDLAGTHCGLSEPEPLNTFECIEGLSNTEVDALILPAYFWDQSDVPSPWNISWTEAAVYRGGL